MEYLNAEDAKAAIDNMHMTELYRQVVKCNLARPTEIFVDGVQNAAVWANREQTNFSIE